MNNFMRWMQHFWLLNLCILRCSLKYLYAFAKGEPFYPVLLSSATESQLNKVKRMGIYEYDCCARYAKKIRKELFAQDPSSLEIILDLPAEAALYDCIPIDIAVFKECISRVAKETGFLIVNQETISYQVSYRFRMRSII